MADLLAKLQPLPFSVRQGKPPSKPAEVARAYGRWKFLTLWLLQKETKEGMETKALRFRKELKWSEALLDKHNEPIPTSVEECRRYLAQWQTYLECEGTS